MSFSLLVGLILSALVVTFSLQNAQVVQIHFMYWYYEGALVFVLLLTFVSGIFSTYLVSLPGRFKRRREFSEVKKQLEQLRREAESVRAAEKSTVTTNQAGLKANYPEKEM